MFTYYHSVEELVRAVYPEKDATAIAFKKKAQSRDLAHQRKVLDRIGNELGLTQVHTLPPTSPRRLTMVLSSCVKLSDWYAVTRVQVEEKGGKTVTHHYRSLAQALNTVYPEYPWDPSKFRASNKTFWRDLKEDMNGALDKVEQQMGILKV